eukprot:TRINITY_DN2369_c0_g6_i1.p1 TRINITY_DN2369_c0_g6~~TRINITY_DN2369_c0_g6_i1.p1  ORF type:complete len:447 (+),score=84.18 TRINITY_DN2369_c0_g6_i1:437-1777(+)
MRESTKALLGFLGTKKRLSIIEGPPGCGKSSTVWLWACNESHSEYIRWVHVDELLRFTSCDMKDSTIFRRTPSDCAEEAISNCRADILVVDGVIRKYEQPLFKAFDWLEQNKERKLILVSSLSVDIKPETIVTWGGAGFFLPSWTLGEYETALESCDLFKSIEMNLPEGDNDREKILNKFYYAGGSARWMFDFNSDEVSSFILAYIEKVTDFESLSSSFVGTKSSVAINHLFIADKNKASFLVSEFAARTLADKCAVSFFSQARSSTLASNPAFDGWILEADFLYQVRRAEKGSGLILLDFDEKAKANPSPTIRWEAACRIRFDKVQDLTAPYDENTWLIPNRWNQGCYDAIQIINKGLRVVQVTRADSHSLKLRYVVELLNELVKNNTIEILEIVFVFPSDKDPNTFHLKYPVGTLGTYRAILRKTNDGNDCFYYGLYRTGNPSS